MNTTKYICISLLLITTTIFSMSACTKDSTVNSKINNGNLIKDTGPDTSTTRLSQRGLYRVSYHSKVEPIPLNRIHSWELHIETAEGHTVDDAKISLYGGMPAHKHGFPTAPRVTRTLGGGNYLIEGLKFSMSGHWELWMLIRTDGQTEKVLINVELP